MSQSVNYQFVHLLWATKNISPLIIEGSQTLLLSYIGGILKGHGGILLAGSATSNHIHLLVKMPINLSIADLVRQIKSCSSRWYKTKDNEHSIFNWNEGYSAFTVSPFSINSVKQYLANEEHRHKKISFEEELMNFLKIQEIKLNPIYLTSTTYTKLIYHFVWSVKNRKLFLKNFLEEPLHECIKLQVEKKHGKLHAIGNVSDHIHLLVECSNKISTATLVQDLKSSTTLFIKSKSKYFNDFSWQSGHGVFSVGKSHFEIVSNYVNNQKEHHRVNSFEEEWNWLKQMNNHT